VITIEASSEIMREIIEREIIMRSWCLVGFHTGSCFEILVGRGGSSRLTTLMTASPAMFEVKRSMVLGKVVPVLGIKVSALTSYTRSTECGYLRRVKIERSRPE
jgi:hypothetical protein